MRNYFTFGNFDSRDFGVFTIREGVYNAPNRAYSVVSVPGRDGDLMIDQGRMENTDVKYPCLIYRAFDSNLEGLRSALLSHHGYVRIVDSFHPDEYRLGVFMDELSVIPTTLGDGGTFDVVFNCKPQRFLISGETAVTGTSIENPTLFPSKPLIRVTGYGTLTVGHDSVTIAQHSQSYIDIDSDIEDCYCGTANMNQYVSLDDFPELEPGINGISKDSTITAVEITPRWYRV